jgi:hypothetical protein
VSHGGELMRVKWRGELSGCVRYSHERACLSEFVRTKSSLVFVFSTPKTALAVSLCRVSNFLELIRLSKYGHSPLRYLSTDILCY